MKPIYCYLSCLSLLACAGRTDLLTPTADNGLGPYYPPDPVGLPFYSAKPLANFELAQSDLTRHPLTQREALGEKVKLSGKVLDMKGLPIPGTLVELWNTNTFGSYVVETNPKGFDEGFFGYGIVIANDQGEFNLITIMPKSYTRYGFLIHRPPHFHLRVSRQGYKTVGIEAELVKADKKRKDTSNEIILETSADVRVPFQTSISVVLQSMDRK